LSAELCGVGVRLVEVRRLRRALDRFGDRLLRRVFTPREIAYAGRKRHGEQSLAARFAAKLAARQLLVEDSGRGARLCDVEVVRRKSGEPELAVRGRTGARLVVSLTHDSELALASVWLERAVADDPVSGAG
jgi:holo-[acyl-carrier protein] synthase